MSQENQPVNLLWTGGWDSTFRLLYLLIKQKRTVQPHYLIETGRRSLPEEFMARAKIKELVFARYPEAKERLCPTMYFDISEIPDMPDVTESFNRLRQRVRIGSQYEWMAKYCIMSGLHNVETCIHTGGMANKLLDPKVRLSDTESDHYYYVDSQYQGTDEYRVFGHYHFPVYDIHKVDMEKVASENGWHDILDLTWFCLRPTANHTPCGMCNPCCMVMKEGMTWRIPLISRLMYYVTLRPQAHTGAPIYKVAKQLKHLVIPG